MNEMNIDSDNSMEKTAVWDLFLLLYLLSEKMIDGKHFFGREKDTKTH